jgi:hypothetical protein
MNGRLNHIVAEQRSAELRRAGEQARTAGEASARRRSARDPEPTRRLSAHLDGRHIAKLDRFVSQAQRAALQADREFDGVSIEVDDDGTVNVHAIGMMSMLLSKQHEMSKAAVSRWRRS